MYFDVSYIARDENREIIQIGTYENVKAKKPKHARKRVELNVRVNLCKEKIDRKVDIISVVKRISFLTYLRRWLLYGRTNF